MPACGRGTGLRRVLTGNALICCARVRYSMHQLTEEFFYIIISLWRPSCARKKENTSNINTDLLLRKRGLFLWRKG